MVQANQSHLLDGVNVEEIASGKAFERTERQQIVKVVSWDVVAADERYLEARRWDFRSPDWKALFPDGFAVIDIGLKGINVEFAFAADSVLHVQIPLRFELGHDKQGQTRGRGSQLHVVNDAFTSIYGVSVIPNDGGRSKVIDVPCLWGQHLGKMDPQPGESQPREWGWDIPRQRMQDGWAYTGEVRKIEGRANANAAGAGGATVGTAQLDEAETNAAVALALNGLDITNAMGHNQAILAIAGLSGNWYDLASGGGNVAQEAHAMALIAAGKDGKIHLPGTENIVPRDTTQPLVEEAAEVPA